MNGNKNGFTFLYKGVNHSAHSIGSSRLPDLKDIITVHVLPITMDNKVVVVNVRSRGIDMIGGHVEANETTALEALYREIDEEAQISIKNATLIDVLEIKSELIKDGDPKYIALYTARIDEFKEFNPSNEISERLTLDIDAFANTYFGKAPEYIYNIYRLALQKL